jgi:hypothetical protein
MESANVVGFTGAAVLQKQVVGAHHVTDVGEVPGGDNGVALLQEKFNR